MKRLPSFKIMNEKTIGYTETKNFRCFEDLEGLYGMKITSMLNLHYCGRENCASGWTFGPFVRENYVIHVVTRGKGTYTTGGITYELGAGDIFVIYPGDETVYSADDNSPWSYAWVGFNGHMAETVVREIGFSRERPVLSIDGVGRITLAIDNIMEYRDTNYSDWLKRNSALYFALALMMEENSTAARQVQSTESGYVQKAIEIINTSYETRLKISEVADQIGINRSYLANIFKREMNVSPQEYLINIRLEKAAQMLRESEEQIGNIANAVGYSDPLAFSKAFRQKYGTTPRAFRQSVPEVITIDKRGGYDGHYNL